MKDTSTITKRVWPCGCIDLETLATSADAVVLEIGCVLFDPVTGELGPEYQAEVEMRASDQRLRAIDPSTFLWWGEQMKKGVDMPGMSGGVALWQAMQGLTAFLEGCERAEDFRMWAWGSDFDFAILRNVYDDAQLPLPWRYSKQCDARSFCELMGVRREGEVRHLALEDARQEALAVVSALRKLASFQCSVFREEGVEEVPSDQSSVISGRASQSGRGPLVATAIHHDGTKTFYYRDGGAA